MEIDLQRVYSYAAAVYVVFIAINLGMYFFGGKELSQKFMIFSAGFALGIVAILIKVTFFSK